MDDLEQLKRAELGLTTDDNALSRLSSRLQEHQDGVFEGLRIRDVIGQIELRAAVELAKRARER